MPTAKCGQIMPKKRLSALESLDVEGRLSKRQERKLKQSTDNLRKIQTLENAEADESLAKCPVNVPKRDIDALNRSLIL